MKRDHLDERRPDKPRLLFVQNRYDARLPPFMLIHVQEQVRCLREFFDVTVIQDDCDYDEICDAHRPDVVLVEAGVNHSSCRRPRVANTHRHAGIPKIGLHHADAFCDARAGFLSDMAHWGIETFFTITTTAAEHTPEMAGNLFCWPVFMDPHLHRDYGLPKSIPVLITGNSQFALYPWRRQVFPLLTSRFPALVCPHPGYDPVGNFAHILVGETYARTLNSTWCVPTCGTVAKEAVRKHFEIPACKAALVTEKSPALEAAGFEDMVNCVFADAHDAVEKVQWLLSNPDACLAIGEAGHALVHSRHTYRSRGQMLAWYRLHKALPDSRRIVQLNPFDLPIAVDKSAAAGTCHVRSEGEHLRLIREGDECLRRRDFAAAEQAYRRCMALLHWMPEPRVRMALCCLHRGDPGAALDWMERPIEFTLRQYRAVDPDPVEWAVWIVTLLCLGALRSADLAAQRYPHLAHPELSRARWLCARLRGVPTPALPPLAETPRRASLHVLPPRTDSEWVQDVSRMLDACGRPEMVQALRQLGKPADRADAAIPATILRAPPWSAPEWALHAHRGSRSLRSGWTRLQNARIRKAAVSVVRSLADRRRHASRRSIRCANEESLARIAQEFASDESRVVALIGDSRDSAVTEAAMSGVKANRNNPRVLCIHDGTAPARHAVHSLCPRFEMNLWRREELAASIDEWAQTGIDVALVDAASFRADKAVADALVRIAGHAQTLIVANSACKLGFLLESALLRDGRFRLVATSENDGGYAVLRRHASVNARAAASDFGSTGHGGRPVQTTAAVRRPASAHRALSSHE